jgi:hypothetical protein
MAQRYTAVRYNREEMEWSCQRTYRPLAPPAPVGRLQNLAEGRRIFKRPYSFDQLIDP